MITFENIKFDAKGTDRKDKVFPISLSGSEDVTIKNCVFENTGYSSIKMMSTGAINIDGCTFNCNGNIYNPVEGGSGANDPLLTKVNITNCEFNGIAGNNYMNFYCLADGAEIHIENVKINNMSKQSECIRVSNMANNNAKFIVKGLEYTYDESTEFDENWTKMILAQDYSQNEVQDFTKFDFDISGIKVNGEEVKDANSFPVGGLFVIYDQYKSKDGESQFPAGNDPHFTFEGEEI